MTEEELLVEAKRRFPKGTILSLTGINKKFKHWLKTDYKISGEFTYSGSVIDTEEGQGHIYEEGAWAEIVSKPVIHCEIY